MILEVIRHWRILGRYDNYRTRVFTRRIKALMSDDDYKEMQEALVNRPDMGAIIQGTGGLRKIRWKLEGKGKSGGVRSSCSFFG